MRDEVYNRALFRRGAKLRQGTEVRGPSGILASSPELMQAAMPRRFQDGGLVPGIMSNPLQMMAMGAAQAMMPRGQRVPETTGGLMGAEGFDVGAVDITQMPVAPRPTAQNRGIEEIQAAIGDNPEAQQRFGNVISTARDPESTPEDLQGAITSAVGAPNTEEGLKETYEYVAGEPAPEGATVDELNKAIMGAALGGAIGGPGSLAERISKAVIGGLTLQREQALAREAAAAVPGVDMMSALYSDSVKDQETKHFGKVPVYMPTLKGSLAGATPIVAGDQDRLITMYNTAMDDSDRLIGLSTEAENLLAMEDVAGFEGAASRLLSRSASALPNAVAAAIGIDKDNLQVSGAQRFDVIQRVLAAQLAPMLLGESGRTISDGDRLRVAALLGITVDDKDGLGLNFKNVVGGAFRSEAELLEAIREVQGILNKNRQEVEQEFSMIMGRVPGARVERQQPAGQPAAPAAAPAQNAPQTIVLTEEDLTRYGG
jgi:hypothetical protein